MRLCLLLAAAAGARARLAPRDREIARLTGGRRLSDSSPGVSFEQLVKMTASDAALDDRFGRSMAVDGDTIVIEAYGDDDETGAVYVLRASDGEELAKLTAADAAPGDQFGWSVAIAGDTIVVGANTAGTGGAAYVFRTSDGGASYGQVAKLTASDAAVDDFFGDRVAISGDTVVVVASNDGNTGSFTFDGSGSVYIFSPPAPTMQPTVQPTPRPTWTFQPTAQPTTSQPSLQPVPRPTPAPTAAALGSDSATRAGGTLLALAAIVLAL